MNENLIEIELDARALEFIKESLTNATGVARWETKQEEMADGTVTTTDVPHDVRQDSLAHHLLKREDLAEGRIITCVLEDVPEDDLYHFRWGGKLKVDPNSIEYWKEGEGILRSVPIEYFGEGVQRLRAVPIPSATPWLVAAVQEYLRSAPNRVCIFDRCIASAGDRWIARSDFQNQVYFALFHKDAESKERVASAISHASDVWLFYGVMSSLPPDSGLDPEGDAITRDAMEMLAQRTEKIVVGAYDGESYLIWSKPGS